jgi:hypothetical protein
MRTVEMAISLRARRVMAVVYGAGIAMAWQYREDPAHPFASSFATLRFPSRSFRRSASSPTSSLQ